VEDSGDLTANEHPLDYAANMDVELFEGFRSVERVASFEGTSRRGRSIKQRSELSIIVDTRTDCRTIDGSTKGSVGRFDFDASLSGLAFCPEQCPTAGTVEGTAHGRLRDHTIEVTFDGSAIARVRGWSGDTFEVDMDCEPGPSKD
jgi:hypothetical protein